MARKKKSDAPPIASQVPTPIVDEGVAHSDPGLINPDDGQLDAAPDEDFDITSVAPDFRELALAHLDALAHATIRSTEFEAERAGIDADALGDDGDAPNRAEPYYDAAAQIEAVAEANALLLPLQELGLRYGLDPVEIDILVWTFVQQNRTEGLPTVGEFLSVRFDVSSARNRALCLFRPEATLRHSGLLRLVVGPESLPDNLLHRVMSLPEPVHAFLMGERSLGELVGTVAELFQPEPFDPDVPRADGSRIGLPAEDELRELVQHYIDRFTRRDANQTWQPHSLVVELCAPPRSGSTATVRELAYEFGALLVELDASRLLAHPLQIQLQLIDEIVALMRLYDAWLTIDRVEALAELPPSLEALAGLTDRVTAAVFVVSRHRLPAIHPLGVRALCHVEIEAPETARQVIWRQQLANEGVLPPADEDLRMLASKFDLSAGLITNAARLVGLHVAHRGVSPDFQELDTSAYHQQRGDLGNLATLRRGRGHLDDLVLPESEKVGIREIIRAATYRTRLLHGWGFKERFTYGTGIIALFSGEPGTGKSFAAEVIAGALGLDLFQIAAQQVVSKWVGETEKQIERIFEEAKATRAVLLFDEADSLLGSRTEVKNASDRYANMATNQLLQAIEAHEGVIILTTNLEENLDAAAERRILFRIRFPFPEKEERAELWRRMLPKGAPLSKDIDFEELGEYFELSGGHIKNAIIRAGYEALERGSSLDMEALMAAAEREATTTGRLVRLDETGALFR